MPRGWQNLIKTLIKLNQNGKTNKQTYKYETTIIKRGTNTLLIRQTIIEMKALHKAEANYTQVNDRKFKKQHRQWDDWLYRDKWLHTYVCGHTYKGLRKEGQVEHLWQNYLPLSHILLKKREREMGKIHFIV